jgi:hypothetical protein
MARILKFYLANIYFITIAPAPKTSQEFPHLVAATNALTCSHGLPHFGHTRRSSLLPPSPVVALPPVVPSGGEPPAASYLFCPVDRFLTKFKSKAR